MVERSVPVDLSGVPETLLWPLHARAAEARRPDGLLRDAKAIELVDAIDYPFEENFGRAAHVIALRELSFDAQVRRFLQQHPNGTVVALADGLNTQFWRLDNGSARWLSVDLPPVIELRRRLLPETARSQYVDCSALDDRWIDMVDASDGVFITAQGLLMYLDEPQVYALLHRCADAFPGGTMMFDAMPWLFTASIGGNTVLNTVFMPGNRAADRYRLPPMPWHSSFERARRRLMSYPSVSSVRFIALPRGRGAVFGFGGPLLDRLPVLRSATPWSALVEFRR